MAAALLMLLLVSPALLMLLVSPAAPDTYEQETHRMFVEWKAKYKKSYKYAGEEECRYAVFKNSRRRVARANVAGVTSSGLNGLNGHASFGGRGVRMGEKSYEEEARRMFVGWKAKYGKTYRDVGEEECWYKLFKANRRVVVKLNAAAAGETAYGINQFGDLTNEEVRECCDGRGGEMEGKLSARCQAAVAGDSVERLIRSQVLSFLYDTESVV
ncbi:oryzain alpha chain-like [Setaria italica]|uniref:oryzain alpha chain-like n=1 Tax=Setaria italica TaxID=4555 RepID=UPI0006475B54|nr:oryzain alpha chain-like [Setaria italica]